MFVKTKLDLFDNYVNILKVKIYIRQRTMWNQISLPTFLQLVIWIFEIGHFFHFEMKKNEKKYLEEKNYQFQIVVHEAASIKENRFFSYFVEVNRFLALGNHQ